MKNYLIATVILFLAVTGLSEMGILALSGPEPRDALAAFNRYYPLVNAGKYVVPLLLLVWIDYLALQRSAEFRMWLLWLPLLIFVLLSGLQWFRMEEAYLHYTREHGLWEGGFSGAIFYMILTYPAALLVTAVNYVVIARRR